MSMYDVQHFPETRSKLNHMEKIMKRTIQFLKVYQLRHSDFIGSTRHLEMERTLISIKTKKQAILQSVYANVESQAEELQSPENIQACVTLQGTKCLLRCAENLSKTDKHQYYLGVFQYGSTVYVTEIGCPDKYGQMELKGEFIFPVMDPDFVIKATLYSMNVPKSIFWPIRFSPFMKFPLMKVTGEVNITLQNTKHDKLILSHPQFSIDVDDIPWLSTKIEIKVNWPSTLKGVVTVGIRKNNEVPTWTLRWCILENVYFKYYDYVTRDRYMPALGELNLSECSKVKYTFYLNKKVIKLGFETTTYKKTVFLKFDRQQEFKQWYDNIQKTITLDKCWKTLDPL
ncbi:hypothetical protein ABEB36_002384 [Hypothenemus hampei]|uniref:PH domain-containing protein n=1 Tax=Hypothenemus hampei TaxID=57062 RepID=A0ABD1F5K7_HYPHA